MSKNIIPLTAERLRELLHYDPETGVFVWRVQKGRRVISTVGKGSAYVRIGVAGRIYYAHKLAWLYVHGFWPPGEIDHANGQKQDNRLCNLREASRRFNTENKRTSNRNNVAGLLGVHFYRRTGRWAAQIHIAAGKQHLGYFDTPEQAHEAYLCAKRKLHEGCTL